MSEVQSEPSQRSLLEEIREDFPRHWRAMPGKGMFFGLLAAWVALFHWLGNSTLGYVDTPSLFGWLHYAYQNSVDDEHGYIIPLVVVALMWWKRRELMEAPKRPWWPGLILLMLALLVHVAGYMVQQTRVSAVAFFAGIYALSGLVWGWTWLRATFFPFFLFAFCIPIATLSEPLTFPLRLLATQITSFVSDVGLGINVVCSGTQIMDANRTYQYEVAAACSGIRSMTAIFAIALVYGFVAFSSPWKRLAMISCAFPLAVLANVVRLCMIIIAAEAFGQSAGNYVHESGLLSMLPYVPAVGGVLLLGHWLKGKRPNREPQVAEGVVMREAPSK
jgi:exosortase